MNREVAFWAWEGHFLPTAAQFCGHGGGCEPQGDKGGGDDQDAREDRRAAQRDYSRNGVVRVFRFWSRVSGCLRHPDEGNATGLLCAVCYVESRPPRSVTVTVFAPETGSGS
jgi:hypothetical protein